MSDYSRDWCVVTPWIGPRDNLEGLLASLGEVTIPYLIVDNSPNSTTKQMNIPQGIEIEWYPQNLGVAASWNRGLARGAKWTLICSASVRFGKGLDHFIKEASKRVSAYGLNPRMAMHLYVVGRAMVDEIGAFDERYWPIYFEDSDYWRRAILAGITGDGCSELPYYHPDDVTCIGDAMAVKSGAVPYNVTNNQNYMIRKWGSLPPHGDDAFKHPFNNPNFPLSYSEPEG